jgi:hypothetical protein
MRFRTKFAWLQFANPVLMAGLSFASFHKHSHDSSGQAFHVAGIVLICLAAFYVIAYFFYWSDVSDSGLVQQRLWNTQTIPWSEITRVAPWRPDKPSLQQIEIDYVRAGPMSDHGSLVVQPAMRDAFVLELRAHAPQAAFEYTFDL